jgi:hypothetical protein
MSLTKQSAPGLSLPNCDTLLRTVNCLEAYRNMAGKVARRVCNMPITWLIVEGYVKDAFTALYAGPLFPTQTLGLIHTLFV